jgi:hypothetical protein
MARLWSLLILVGLVVLESPVDAQVFKPKGKKSEATAKKSGKKAPKKAVPKKKKGGKKAAAERDRDEESESPSKSGSDFVKITDDDEIE